jgi:hypothetical protein
MGFSQKCPPDNGKENEERKHTFGFRDSVSELAYHEFLSNEEDLSYLIREYGTIFE